MTAEPQYPGHWQEMPLVGSGPIASAFKAAGMKDYGAALRVVHGIPYGRNEDKAHLLCVLQEGKGTCSTKHFLLKALADEIGLTGVDLYLGVFEMGVQQFPHLGRVLEPHGLDAIPEAHCYLKAKDRIVDITFPGTNATGLDSKLLHEESIPLITPQEKEALHRQYIEKWLIQRPGLGLDTHALWGIREACIAALSTHNDD